MINRAEMEEALSDVMIFPGELLSTIPSHSIKLGPGLRHMTSPSGDTMIQATQAGVLRQAKQSDYYIDYNSHRVFIPSSCQPNFSTFLAKENLSLDKSSHAQQIITEST